MEKKWYKSKTVWGSILLAVLGIAQIVENGSINIGSLTTIAASFGLYGLRHAQE